MTETSIQAYLAPSADCMQDADTLCQRREELTTALRHLESAVMPEDVPAIERLNDSFADLAVNVSLIGQVKAGKTALANALLGQTDLLPSDVNPWTSVVTSIHLNQEAPKGKAAIFKFFSAEDWDDLVSKSGRIVELAREAKLDTRVDELTAQIEELKARTEGRLGRNFKFLLGNQHAFSSFTPELITRYVCLGEEGLQDDRHGRFADLTKSADLFMDSPSFSYPITIADTPGVNDPLLVREAATIDNLRKSDIFVVVLSAHQALSSVDLGLLRLLKSLHSNRLIVFVNRVDELTAPQAQICEIREYAVNMLRRQGIPEDVPVIFGSAAWADAALRNSFETLPEDSVDSLRSLIDARTQILKDGATDTNNVRNLQDVSGISALRAAIHHMAWNAVFKRKMSKIASQASGLVERSILYLSKFDEAPGDSIAPQDAQEGIDILNDSKARIEQSIATFERDAADRLKMNMVTAYMGFKTREMRALQAYLSKSTKLHDWEPETEALRDDLNQAYSAYVAEAHAFLRDLNANLTRSCRDAYAVAVGSSEGMRILSPQLAELPMPVSLMRTMNIDLRASNSFEWLRRKLDKSIYLDQFEATISADSRIVVAGACKDGITDYFADARLAFDEVIDGHLETIEAMAKTGGESIETRIRNMMDQDQELANRLKTLCRVGGMLHQIIGEETPQKASGDALLKEPA